VRRKTRAPIDIPLLHPDKGGQILRSGEVVVPRAKSSNQGLPIADQVGADVAGEPRQLKQSTMRMAKYSVGDVVKHRIYPFRGIVFDIDPIFNSTEEWWSSIPAEIRPTKNQPFYHLLAENDKTEYIAYVSEQNLLPDDSGKPLRHPQVGQMFAEKEGIYKPTFINAH
jgi:heat shock protein HspQ